MGGTMDETARRRFAPGWLRNLLLMLASTLASLLVVEVALRLYRPDDLRLFPRFHESVRYGPYVLRRTRPDTRFEHSSVDGSWRFAINAQGFRDDRDYSHAKAEGSRRVLVLGDSQAMGYENDLGGTLPVQLAAELRRRGRPAEVLNSGVAGFGTAEELAFLENEGLRYQPDAVLLMFYRNDYSDNVRSGLFALSDGTLVPRSHQYAPGTAILERINDIAAVRWLSQHSYTYSLFFNFVWNTAKKASIKAANDSDERVVTPGAIQPGQTRLAIALVLRMERTLAARGIALLVIDVPEVPLSGSARDFRPSIEPEMLAELRAQGVRVLGSEEVLGLLRGRATFHRPDGERHVIAQIHAVLARAAAGEIERALGNGTSR